MPEETEGSVTIHEGLLHDDKSWLFPQHTGGQKASEVLKNSQGNVRSQPSLVRSCS